MLKLVKTHKYKQPTAGYAGYIEPADRSWILFVGTDGSAKFYGKRDPKTGAVIE